MTPKTPMRAGYLAVSGLVDTDCVEEVREALLVTEGVYIALVFPDEGMAVVAYTPRITCRANLQFMVKAAAIAHGRDYRVGWMGSRRMEGVDDERVWVFDHGL